jgi:hypothetical protein
MSETGPDRIPLAAIPATIAAPDEIAPTLAFVSRVPPGGTFREMIERAVGWSRR